MSDYHLSSNYETASIKTFFDSTSSAILRSVRMKLFDRTLLIKCSWKHLVRQVILLSEWDVRVWNIIGWRSLENSFVVFCFFWNLAQKSTSNFQCQSDPNYKWSTFRIRHILDSFFFSTYTIKNSFHSDSFFTESQRVWKEHSRVEVVIQAVVRRNSFEIFSVRARDVFCRNLLVGVTPLMTPNRLYTRKYMSVTVFHNSSWEFARATAQCNNRVHADCTSGKWGMRSTRTNLSWWETCSGWPGGVPRILTLLSHKRCIYSTSPYARLLRNLIGLSSPRNHKLRIESQFGSKSWLDPSMLPQSSFQQCENHSHPVGQANRRVAVVPCVALPSRLPLPASAFMQMWSFSPVSAIRGPGKAGSQWRAQPRICREEGESPTVLCAKLVVLASEVAGRWSEETIAFFRHLAKARAREEPIILKKGGRGMAREVVFSVRRSTREQEGVDGETSSVHNVLSDWRFAGFDLAAWATSRARVVRV